MEVRNLSQLKKAFKENHLFVIMNNPNFPDRTGQIRIISKLQSNGFYSKVFNDPANELNTKNRGLGSWLDFGKSDNWNFSDNGICTNYLISKDGTKWDGITIQILDDIGGTQNAL